MRILHVNQSDNIGGAAKAAARLHRALLAQSCASQMLVDQASHTVPSVICGTGRWDRLTSPLRARLSARMLHRLETGNPVAHEPALFSSASARALTGSSADLVNLHWVSDNMLSIRAIGRIALPLVWTLHDMWAFCGAEHYTEDTRWRDGYLPGNRPAHESGYDLNRRVWTRKRRAWRRPIHIVTPSSWLAKLARESVLMRDWPVEVIPNAIDTGVWRPGDRLAARRLLGLDEAQPLLLFGAMGGNRDPRKGFDLLMKTLAHLNAGSDTGIGLMVFGRVDPGEMSQMPFPVTCFGHLVDEISLRLLYTAADLFVLPSRLDNLPNTAVEALSCGIPVAGFGTGGMPDLVTHRENGYLAAPLDTADLARGIAWVLERQRADNGLGVNARRHAVANYAQAPVARRYIELYNRILRKAPPRHEPTTA